MCSWRVPQVQVRLDVLRHAILRDLVVRERGSCIDRQTLRVRASPTLRIRIVDWRQRRTIKVPRQIARAPRVVRNRDVLHCFAPLLEAFVVEEEERPVLAIVNLRKLDRTAQREAKLVELEVGPPGSEVRSGVQLRVAKELIRAAVILVCA